MILFGKNFIIEKLLLLFGREAVTKELGIEGKDTEEDVDIPETMVLVGIVLAWSIVLIRSNGAVKERDNIPATAPDNNNIDVGVSFVGSSGSANDDGPTAVRNHVWNVPSALIC